MPLTLKGSSSGGVTIDVPATAGNNTLTFPAATGTALVGTTTTANQVFFGGATSGTLSQDSSLFWDNTNKRLGIGTASPAVTLDVVGQQYVSGEISVGNTAASGSGGVFRMTGSGGNGYIQVGANRSSGSAGDIIFTSMFGVSEYMRIKSDGSVGIGTTSPVSKLHVSGGNIQFQNTTGAAYAYASNDSGQLYLGINNSAGTTFGGIGAYGRLIYGSGAYPLGFFTNDTLRLTLDAVGNLGLGVTPSAWVTYKALQIASTGGALSSSLSSDLELTTNAYYSSQWLSQGAGVASTRYRLYQGTHAWFTSGTSPGASGTPITFTQAMTLDANGNLGIASGANQKLTVGGGIQIVGSASLGASSSPGIFSYEYPITRCYVGDGSGYSWAFSKRSSSTTTDLVRISDAGDLSVSLLNSGAWSQTINSISLNNGRILCTKNDDWNIELYGTGGNRVRIYNTSNTATVGSIQADANTARFNAGNVQLNYNGIGFPATQNPSSDVNTLDDYEEGTFTVGISGAGGPTVSAQQCNYIKIGKIVHVNIRLNIRIGTASGSQTITNLPYPASTTYANYRASGSGFWDNTVTSVINSFCTLVSGSTTLYGYRTTAGSTSPNLWVGADWQSASDSILIYTITYWTDA